MAKVRPVEPEEAEPSFGADSTLVHCKRCNASFKNAIALNMHNLRKHGKLRGATRGKASKLKFACSDCPRKFTTQRGLSKHKTMHQPKGATNGSSTQAEARAFSEADVQFAQHVSFLAGSVHKEIRLFAERHDVSGEALTSGVAQLLRDPKVR